MPILKTAVLEFCNNKGELLLTSDSPPSTFATTQAAGKGFTQVPDAEYVRISQVIAEAHGPEGGPVVLDMMGERFLTRAELHLD